MQNTRFSLALATIALSTLATVTGCSGGDVDDRTAAGTDDVASAAAASRRGGRFTQLKKGPTDPDLAALSAVATTIDGPFLGTYRFNKAGPEKTDPVAREKRIKEVMHRFMCTLFDESIDIARFSGPSALDKTLNNLDFRDNAGVSEAETTKFKTALSAVLANKQLDVESGRASGNNTAGEVMGVYDIAHNEVLFFGFTNCGSDS